VPSSSRHADVGKAMDYMLERWDAFTHFVDGWPDLPHQQGVIVLIVSSLVRFTVSVLLEFQCRHHSHLTLC
jgi:hypothetical protein